MSIYVSQDEDHVMVVFSQDQARLIRMIFGSMPTNVYMSLLDIDQATSSRIRARFTDQLWRKMAELDLGDDYSHGPEDRQTIIETAENLPKVPAIKL